MTREEYEIRKTKRTKWGWDSYGNPIEKNLLVLFFRFFEPRIRRGDVVEYVTVEYNPQTKKKEKKYLQGIWDGEKVHFDYQETVVRTKHWLRLVSREYKFGKIIVKRNF